MHLAFYTRFFIVKTALALAKMRLVTPLLLVGVCSTPCSAQIPQAVAKLANVKNLGIGSAFTGFLTALKVENVKPVKAELKALEAPKETPEKYKGLRQLLGTVVAELAVVAILI